MYLSFCLCRACPKVVTVLFNRIDVDTEDFLKIAAKNSMRSLFALEHAFMQVRGLASKVSQGFNAVLSISQRQQLSLSMKARSFRW